MTSEQDEDGSLPDVVPFVRFGGRPPDVLGWVYKIGFTNCGNMMIVRYCKEHLDDILSQLDNVKMQAKAG